MFVFACLYFVTFSPNKCSLLKKTKKMRYRRVRGNTCIPRTFLMYGDERQSIVDVLLLVAYVFLFLVMSIV